MEESTARDKTHIVNHSLLLLAVVLLVFLWAVSGHEAFATQIIASLLAFYLTKHLLFRHFLSTRNENLIDSLVLTTLVLVIVSATGGLASPLFFLVYFLLFTLSLLLDPTIPLVLSFSLIIYFLFSTAVTQNTQLLPLFSFPLITPLAVYFGREHKKGIYQKHDNLHLKESIRRETTDVLLWLSTTFSRETGKIAGLIEQFPLTADIQKPFLNNLREEVVKLQKLGEKLKKAIEED